MLTPGIVGRHVTFKDIDYEVVACLSSHSGVQLLLQDADGVLAAVAARLCVVAPEPVVVEEAEEPEPEADGD